MTLAFDSWCLGIESSTVIAMRMARLSTGDAAAAAEARLMIAEKIEAMAALQIRAWTGTLGSAPEHQARATVAHYRKAVGKNRRRLGQ